MCVLWCWCVDASVEAVDVVEFVGGLLGVVACTVVGHGFGDAIDDVVGELLVVVSWLLLVVVVVDVASCCFVLLLCR